MFLLALAVTVTPLPPTPMTMESFQDAITDRVSAQAVIREGDTRLSVGCEQAGGEVKVTVFSNRWLVRGALFYGRRNFIYRFDQQRPERRLWVPDDRSASLVSKRRIVPFLRAMTESNALVIRMRDVEDRWFDTRFRLVGARPALAQLFEACRRPDLAERILGAS